ncbi:DNA-binding transcriptional regulator, LysR family [Chromobacterium violaceum]|uniref:LysR family transcriptional regulator n=1 Tax=Chromobacterium violaceum TaxID=536 RepID=UPI0005BBAAF3|nr:LysR family transcriptional regulator [Chromobacterium violaceum]KMN51001.1 hypothetical protein VK93_03405 [Chromobacterium violaceum]KMN86280.1 hypothetical protein VL02_10945 [Chromobacterium violaceum]KMN89844.1 hypothetical protein VL04_12670 [Chromobacterium violaceum]KMO04989.1 hypothetical protein VL16_05105 [Chromobacterium violaceum]MBA8734994.1 LysR family transcriptional regulator [Chromobacterium violaceum]
MEFNDQRVRYFFEAARLGGVRAAADRMDIAASAVSRQIRQLEMELGATLFERHRRGFQPTEAGRLLLDYHRKQLSEQEAVLTALRELKGIHRGHVSVVTGGGVISDLIDAIHPFSQRYPQITVGIDIRGTNDIVRAVLEDRAHIGIVFYTAPNPLLRVHRSSIQPLYAVAAPDHPLARAERPIRLEELARHKLALPDVSFGVRQILRDAEKAEQCQLEPAIVTNSFRVMVEYALTGQAATVQPRFSVRRELESGQLQAIPIQQRNLQQAEVHLITHHGRRLSPAAARLLETLAASMPAFRDSAVTP